MKKLLLSLAALAMAATMSAQVVFSEDFESCTQEENYYYNLPSTWTTISDNLTNFSSSQGSYAQWGTSWRGINFTSGLAAGSCSYTMEATECDRWLISPEIVLPASGNVNLLFSAMGTRYQEKIKVMVSTTGINKTDFTLVQDFTFTNGWEDAMVSLNNYLGETIHIAFVNHGTDALYTAVDNIQVGVFADDEIAATEVILPAYAPMNTPVQVQIKVTNRGMAALTSFDAQYIADNGTPVLENVTGINVPYNGTYTYTFNAPFMISTEGAVTVDVVVLNPNGNADNASDNAAQGSVAIYDASNAYQRTTLLEHFTTAKCPNCPPADQRIETALEGRNDVIWLAHHAGYYTDIMTCTEDEQLLAFYNAGGSTYAPGMMLDRSVEFGEDATTPVQVPGQPATITSLLNNALSVPSFASVAISNVNFDANSRTLTATVSGNIAAGMIANPRLALYLMEDSILYTQSGASGKISHQHVMRKAISDLYGDAVEEGAYTKNFTYTVPQDFKMHKCKLIAFVANYNSNILDRRIINATQTAYINAPYVGIDEVSSEVVMNVYPNPTTSLVNVAAAETIREVRIINAVGQEVYVNNSVNAEALQVNTTSFAAGMYMVTVKTDNGVATSRLNVVR